MLALRLAEGSFNKASSTRVGPGSAVDYDSVRSASACALAVEVASLVLAAILLALSLRSHPQAFLYAVELAIYPPFLFAMRRLSRALDEPRIFRYGALVVVAGAAGLAFALAAPPATSPRSLAGSAELGALGLGSYLIVVIDGYLFRRTYEALSERTAPISASASRRFARAARWIWLGSLLTIVVVGAVLMSVGAAYALLGYLELARLRPPAVK